ncbi:MAG: PadR family transcriptional regulator [Bauldia sp.]|uniref:PadR family transcriptional regulator n=1 Tax=Bauldia sp. TaxID=2575872 RepID=UPI001D7BCCC9|nr:PadR family transcriptional regulator [Bauldia sp.]MCB1496079.1 PadR family transcriptional regulator [Bauldia sp.]
MHMCHHSRHHALRAAARHGFGGMGHRGGPFGGRLRGPPDPFRGGKMIADGDLRLVVLALLAERPRHGYDVIKALEERSHGAYSPSPGVVYPTLTYLEEAGYATAQAEGNKKVYAITDAGRGHLDENRGVAEGILSEMAAFGERMAQARAWYYHREDGAANDIPGVIPEVNEARRTLKAAIAGKLDAPEEEQRRVARILNDAAAAIRGPDL